MAASSPQHAAGQFDYCELVGPVANLRADQPKELAIRETRDTTPFE
jgi:hypothetical protein